MAPGPATCKAGVPGSPGSRQEGWNVSAKKASRSGRKVTGHRTRTGRERRERTRSRILAAALRVFAERGPDSPVIDEFVRAAGVSRGTFYNHFKSTTELLEATSNWLEEDMMLSIEEEISVTEDPVDRLTAGVRLWLRRAASDPAWCAFVVRSRRRSPLVETQLTGDLRDGRRAGAFTFARLEVARDMVVGTILEAMTRLMQGDVPRSYGEEVTRIVLRGLGLSETAIAAGMSRPVPELRRAVKTVP